MQQNAGKMPVQEKGNRLAQLAANPLSMIAILFLCAFVYFVPNPGFNKIIMGTDDGPRGWFEKGNIGHSIEEWSDIWSPLNGGSAVMERRFGRFINPSHLFHLVLPKYQARVLEYVLWTFVGGLFMFLFLGELGVSRPISLVTALGFMFAPALQSYVFAGHFARMEVVALTPGILYCTERLLKKMSFFSALLLPALIAFAVYSEHLQLAYFAFLGMGVWFSARMLWQVFRTRKVSIAQGSMRSGLFAAAVIMGTFLTAMNIFPSMEHTDATSKRAGGVDYAYASSFAAHPEEIASLVQPDFVGWKEYYWGRNPLKLNSEYFGIVFVLGAILLFVLRKPDFKITLLTVFFFAAMAFALGPNTPVHRIAYHLLPGIKSFRAPGMMYIWFFIAALSLAALAFDLLLRVDLSDERLRKRLYLFGGISGGFLLLYALFCGPLTQWWYETIYPLELRDQRKWQALTANLKNAVPSAFVTLLAGGGFLIAAWLLLKRSISRTAFCWIVVGLLAIDLLRVSRPFLSQAIQPKNIFAAQERAEESIGDFLNKKDPGRYRVHTMLGDMKQYIAGLDLTYIFDDFTAKRYDDIIQIVQNAGRMVEQGQGGAPAQGVFVDGLRLLSARYILATSDFEAPGLTRYLAQGQLRIYRVENTLPMVRLAQAVRTSDQPDQELLQLLSSGQFDERVTIVDKNAPVEGIAQTLTDSANTASCTVDLWNVLKGKVAITVNSPTPQVLILSQNYQPQWSATINGSPVKVFPADYLWNAVSVPAGSSKIEFTYYSHSAGKWRRVTLISFILYLLAAAAVITWSLLAKKKSAKG